MKTILSSLLIVLVTSNAWAYLREGNFNYQRRSYYSNGTGAYCERTQYDPSYRELRQREVQEMRYTRFDGLCADGWGMGAFNYQGRSYYANRERHYCQYRYYNHQFREVEGREARYIFSGTYDGICKEQ